MRFFSSVGAIVLLVALAGCGNETADTTTVAAGTDTAATFDTATDTTQDAASPAATGPCAALSASEVTEIMGMPMKLDEGGDENGCSYLTTDDLVRVIIRRMDADGYDLVAQSQDAQPVSGIGERAFWDTSISTLMAVKGDGMLHIAYDEPAGLPEAQRATEAQKKERVTAIARKVIPRF